MKVHSRHRAESRYNQSGIFRNDEGGSKFHRSFPLTTVVHALMEEGSTKEAALQSTAIAFGFSPDVDVTNVDPIQAAGQR